MSILDELLITKEKCLESKEPALVRAINQKISSLKGKARTRLCYDILRSNVEAQLVNVEPTIDKYNEVMTALSEVEAINKEVLLENMQDDPDERNPEEAKRRTAYVINFLEQNFAYMDTDAMASSVQHQINTKGKTENVSRRNALFGEKASVSRRIRQQWAEVALLDAFKTDIVKEANGLIETCTTESEPDWLVETMAFSMKGFFKSFMDAFDEGRIDRENESLDDLADWCKGLVVTYQAL